MLKRTGNQRARASDTLVFPAPTAGWVQSGNVVQAPLNQAEVLDNFIPTAQGARLRGGSQEYADLGAAVVRMFTYVSGGVTDLFPATETKVYNAASVNAGTTLDGDGSELITNGTFDSDLSGWTTAGSTDWSQSGGEAVYSGSAALRSFLQQSFARDGAKVYSLTLTVTSGTGLTITAQDKAGGNPDVTLEATAGTGTFSGAIPDGYDTLLITNSSGANVDATLDNVSVQVGVPIAELEGLTSGDWSATQISTSGGQFAVAVNGADYGMYWDGAEFNPITTVAVNEVPFDAETAAFAVGETVTGGTSGATAEILAITKTGINAGKLKIGAITSGPFQDNEALTDGATGAATASGASASASSVTITNVATKDLNQVWLFKERLFFVEKNSASAWYLPVKSIGGAASELNLGSVFAKGGNLLFGATWSLDSGSGLDDVCLFVSDRGEVAVYEGTDPASASSWSLVGVYEIGDPLNKHAFFKAGGDLAVLTKDGIVPISAAVKKDRAALQLDAITYPIEDAWRSAITSVSSTNPVSASLWQSGALLLIGTPEKKGGKPVSFVANARTGAWGRITGWDVICSQVADDTLYFGTSGGKVLVADAGGTDDGTAFTGIYVPKFKPSKDWAASNAAGLTYRARENLTFSLGASADYTVSEITSSVAATSVSGDEWGTGVWGTFVWGNASDLQSFTEWQSVASGGYAHAPGVAITSNQVPLLVFEVQVMRLRTESGYAL